MDGFDQGAYLINLAGVLSVLPEKITLTVEPASVRVTAVVECTDMAQAQQVRTNFEAFPISALEISLQVQVMQKPPVELADSPASALAASKAHAPWNGSEIAGAVVFVVAILVALVVWAFMNWRKKGAKMLLLEPGGRPSQQGPPRYVRQPTTRKSFGPSGPSTELVAKRRETIEMSAQI